MEQTSHLLRETHLFLSTWRLPLFVCVGTGLFGPWYQSRSRSVSLGPDLIHRGAIGSVLKVCVLKSKSFTHIYKLCFQTREWVVLCNGTVQVSTNAPWLCHLFYWKISKCSINHKGVKDESCISLENLDMMLLKASALKHVSLTTGTFSKVWLWILSAALLLDFSEFFDLSPSLNCLDLISFTNTKLWMCHS